MTRLNKLTSMLEADPADAFVLYGLAQEHSKLGGPTDLALAVDYFDRCLTADPTHAYAYYHKAATLLKLDRPDEARATLQAGISQAKHSGDAKALGELQSLMEACEP